LRLPQRLATHLNDALPFFVWIAEVLEHLGPDVHRLKGIMINRRFLAIAASASIAFAGCASSAASTAPSTSPTSAGSKAAATAATPAVKFIFEGGE
jgi:hypothetical protein